MVMVLLCVWVCNRSIGWFAAHFASRSAARDGPLHDIRGFDDTPGLLGNDFVDYIQQTHLHYSSRGIYKHIQHNFWELELSPHHHPALQPFTRRKNFFFFSLFLLYFLTLWRHFGGSGLFFLCRLSRMVFIAVRSLGWMILKQSCTLFVDWCKATAKRLKVRSVITSERCSRFIIAPSEPTSTSPTRW